MNYTTEVKSADCSAMLARLTGELNTSTPPVCQRTIELSTARHRLSTFVCHMADVVCRTTGIQWEESDDKCFETWPEVKAMFQRASMGLGLVYVRKSSSGTSIYTGEYVNWAFRLWHDYLHYKHDLSFSFIDEILVSNFSVEAVEQEFGVGSLEAKLMAADTYGQVVYFRVHGEFVDDQLAFAEDFIKIH